jgi:hypothetical protein
MKETRPSNGQAAKHGPLRNSVAVRITPTVTTATLAGAFAGFFMPLLWARLASDSAYLIIAFLLVVALPAHALVAGFGWQQRAGAALDTALLKRIGAWLLSAVLAAGVSQLVNA